MAAQELQDAPFSAIGMRRRQAIDCLGQLGLTSREARRMLRDVKRNGAASYWQGLVVWYIPWTRRYSVAVA